METRETNLSAGTPEINYDITAPYGLCTLSIHDSSGQTQEKVTSTGLVIYPHKKVAGVQAKIEGKFQGVLAPYDNFTIIFLHCF